MICPLLVHAVHVCPRVQPPASWSAAEHTEPAVHAGYSALAAAMDATGPKQPTVNGAYEVTW